MNYKVCELLEKVRNLIKIRTKYIFNWNSFLCSCFFNLLEYCKCARMRFHWANSLVVMRKCAVAHLTLKIGSGYFASPPLSDNTSRQQQMNFRKSIFKRHMLFRAWYMWNHSIFFINKAYQLIIFVTRAVSFRWRKTHMPQNNPVWTVLEVAIC